MTVLSCLVVHDDDSTRKTKTLFYVWLLSQNPDLISKKFFRQKSINRSVDQLCFSYRMYLCLYVTSNDQAFSWWWRWNTKREASQKLLQEVKILLELLLLFYLKCFKSVCFFVWCSPHDDSMDRHRTRGKKGKCFMYSNTTNRVLRLMVTVNELLTQSQSNVFCTLCTDAASLVSNH